MHLKINISRKKKTLENVQCENQPSKKEGDYGESLFKIDIKIITLKHKNKKIKKIKVSKKFSKKKGDSTTLLFKIACFIFYLKKVGIISITYLIGNYVEREREMESARNGDNFR